VRRQPPGLTARILISALGALTVSALVTAGDAAAEPGDGIEATGATVDRVGWWHEKNVATETPAGIVTVPPPPGVPAGSLAVGAINGEPDRITAIGILPEAAPGDAVSSFTLAIREAEPPATNANSESAGIVACPITSFWVAAQNGTWESRPDYDCELAQAPGKRAEDGTWTFDLLPIGQAWLDPAGSLAADGIVLVEDIESPGAFQTVFATEGEGALVVTFESTPATPTSDPAVEPATTDDSFSDVGDLVVPDLGTGDVPVGDLPAPVVTTATTEAAAPPVATAPVAASPNVLGNLPGGLVVAIPTFLVLMGLLSYSLGPAGEPVAATRQGGVSRALAARARSGPSPRPTSLED
jgi:hypothetical protein